MGTAGSGQPARPGKSGVGRGVPTAPSGPTDDWQTSDVGCAIAHHSESNSQQWCAIAHPTGCFAAQERQSRLPLSRHCRSGTERGGLHFIEKINWFEKLAEDQGAQAAGVCVQKSLELPGLAACAK